MDDEQDIIPPYDPVVLWLTSQELEELYTEYGGEG